MLSARTVVVSVLQSVDYEVLTSRSGRLWKFVFTAESMFNFALWLSLFAGIVSAWPLKVNGVLFDGFPKILNRKEKLEKKK